MFSNGAARNPCRGSQFSGFIYRAFQVAAQNAKPPYVGKKGPAHRAFAGGGICKAGYRNGGPGPGRLFTVFNSAVMEELAEAIGQRIDDPAHPPVPPAPAPEGLRRAGELMQQYQVENQSPSQNFR